MEKKIFQEDKIFIAGSSGMAGKAIVSNLRKKGYGQKDNKGILLTPNRQELDLLDD